MARGPGALDKWARRLFRLAVVAFAFGAGLYVAWARVFPWGPVQAGVKTTVSAVMSWREDRPRLGVWGYADVPVDSVGAKRVRLTAEGGSELRDPVVLVDVPGSFGDRCPGALGCLAVEYEGRGQAGRTWLAASLPNGGGSAPLEKALGVVSAELIKAHYATPYPNGDLLVSFWYDAWHYPGAAGVGRVGQDGQLQWFTTEGYSHHEAHVGAGDTVWIAGLTLEEPNRRLPGGLGDWQCDREHLTLDRVNVLDENGALVDSISVLDAFLASAWAPALIHADPCDPFHLNSVALVGEDVSGLPDVRPGDLVLSLRNLHAFAVLDRETGVVKRYATGTFVRPHSAKHLGGSEFVLFDNKGGYAPLASNPHWYSRVLVVDLASGEERVVFPRTAERRWQSAQLGRISLSPDRARVLASVSRAGRAVEVRIADGAVLAEFDFVHDVRRFGRFPADSGAVRSGEGAAFYAREAR